ncbi:MULTISPECIES: CidA/LrgA family protein [Clostridium]|uniref:LrgA family protein n=1 Tax=Clostridium disporicum TaxID=84024 RepID=A0A174DVQ0_9CLOT|nr:MULTISPECIES: CidA/LrgA family protein [Clostridium]MCD2500434.1 CidA/LrgA family protein [Clostridium sp. NSJ-145]MDU6341258.1 CidA/LrgA family protein [Clostridium sp.]CUO27970.1 LrgA family protein [Clostridium disporicum]
MKIFREFIIILVLYFIGELISKIFNIPIPGNIIAMILLFVSLCTGIIKVEKVDDISTFFLDHLAFFFIPAGVGLINSFDSIKSSAIQIIIICIITTIIVMAVTGIIVQFTSNMLAKKKEDKKSDYKRKDA